MNIEMLEDFQKRRGVPLFLLIGGINPPNVIAARKALANKPRGGEIDIILHSGGGQASDAFRMIKLFRNHYDTVNVIIPFWAKSAATLLALGASNIILQECGELGPLDAQIKKDDDEKRSEWESALNVQASLEKIEERSREGFMLMLEAFAENEQVRLGRRQLAELLLDYSAKFYQPLVEKIDTYEIGKMTRTLDIGRQYAQRILREYNSIEPHKMRDFLDFLVYDCPDHGFIIDYPVLSEYLKNVHRAEDYLEAELQQSLEKFSIFLMESSGGGDIAVFVDDLVDSKDDDIIEGDGNDQSKADESEQPQGVGTVPQPQKGRDKKAPKSDPGSDAKAKHSWLGL